MLPSTKGSPLTPSTAPACHPRARAACSSDTSARLWDLSGDPREAIKVYSGHHKAVTCCALNDSS